MPTFGPPATQQLTTCAGVLGPRFSGRPSHTPNRWCEASERPGTTSSTDPSRHGRSDDFVRIWPERAGSAARPRGPTPTHTRRREPFVTQRPSYNARPPAGPFQRGLGDVFHDIPPFGPISPKTGRRGAISCDLPMKLCGFLAPLGPSGYGANT